MKRIIPFPSTTSRTSDRFDPSKQANLKTLHVPRLLTRSLEYNTDGVSPSRRHHAPVAVDYAKSKAERFRDSADVLEELREEKLALRDPQRLDALLDRQEKRMHYALHATPNYDALSNRRVVGTGPMISFTQGSRGLLEDTNPKSAHGSLSPTSAKQATHAAGAGKLLPVVADYLSGNEGGGAASSVDVSVTAKDATAAGGEGSEGGDDRRRNKRGIASSLPDLDASLRRAVYPSQKGAVAMERTACRYGKSPWSEQHGIHGRSATSLGTTGAGDATVVVEGGVPRSESVPLTSRGGGGVGAVSGGTQRTLGDVLHGGAAHSTTPGSVVDESRLPPVVTPAANEPPAASRTGAAVVSNSSAARMGGTHHHGFFLSKSELFALRDLPAPDLKRKPGREKDPPGQRRIVYPFENPNIPGDFPLIDVCQADAKTQHPHVPQVANFGKQGREPLQPPPTSQRDPLVVAARRAEEDITDSLCPDYTKYLLRKRVLAQKEKERLRKLEQSLGADLVSSAAEWSVGLGSGGDAPMLVGSSGASAIPQAGALEKKERHDTTSSPVPRTKKPRRATKPHREPLYTVGPGGGRITLNTDVLFRGRRFQELLEMHDYMIERELAGDHVTSRDRQLEAEEAAEMRAELRDKVLREGGSEGNLGLAQGPPMTVAEKLKKGVHVSFEEAFAEAERREHLLQLKYLSLTKDSSARGPGQQRGSMRIRGASFAASPDRSASPSGAGGGSFEENMTRGVPSTVKAEAAAPATRAFRSHLKLKAMYDAIHQSTAAEESGGNSSEGHHALRKLSMIM